MPVKINELVIQVKVYESNQQIDNPTNRPANFLLHTTTEQQKVTLARDLLSLLKDQETR